MPVNNARKLIHFISAVSAYTLVDLIGDTDARLRRAER